MEKMQKKHFERKPDKKVEGKRIDPVQELRKAYKEPQKVAYVGRKGFV
jgi:hypothetical protein